MCEQCNASSVARDLRFFVRNRLLVSIVERCSRRLQTYQLIFSLSEHCSHRLQSRSEYFRIALGAITMSESCGSELLPASQDSSSAGLPDDGSCTSMASPGPRGDGNISEGSVSGASDFEDRHRRSRRHWTDARPTVDEVGQGITSL